MLQQNQIKETSPGGEVLKSLKAGTGSPDLGSGAVLDQTYQILQEIGKVGTSVVYLAWHLNLRKYVVVKKIRIMSDSTKFRIEADTLKKLHHPNLPQVYDFIERGTDVYTIMDYIHGTDLGKIAKSEGMCSIEDLTHWFRQLTEVLVYLQRQNPPVVHSDIKPGNIIITPENDAVLIDFNISVSVQPDTVVGYNMIYASPEQIALMQQRKSHQPTGEILDGRSDIYSLAATFYYLMSRIRPSLFYGTKPLREIQTGYPKEFCDIIDKAMQVERDARYQNAQELEKALRYMYKKTAGYRRRVALTAAAIVIGACVIAGVSWKMIRDNRTEERNRMKAAYNECVQYINRGDTDTAVTECLDFLNEYDPLLEEDPEVKAEILMGLGQSYYEQGAYEDAARSYREAAQLMSAEDEKLADCYYGGVAACAANGESGAAQYLIREAKERGLSAEQLSLFRIQMESQSGQTVQCLAEIQTLLSETDEPGIVARAALIAADSESSEEGRLQWYELAAGNAGSDPGILRQSGYSMFQLAAESKDQKIRRRGLETAENCYRVLVECGNASGNDYLNLSSALRLLNQCDEAVRVLDELENSKIQSVSPGVLYMNKAFCYHQKGDSVRAADMIRNAKSRLKPSDVSQEEWAELNRLADVYDV